ncbi:2-succinyl-5-enolpyruvyl-6-hydroxy-3-cyclohexene-1-carboxylate synthase [Rhodobium orientis]|uniref:2-succinyl-5-enolpyruvyl-6-hydroxy-3-cyclohexene-1-carboxylate synthase n=1 Tax=Rhodobium orientis TaxID=34017 RepID=A0A327JKJ6_9HYPH|nr:2-succinyl-5-enolpyruvyl-6-hydroxy-3-cyclohexene-1-carboxylic-acid synthase [Rhodobium orientis]MBB4301346.1 2-succinyl-5-enolpyruvyl-6-hydroxy-3-cyclohexene-1-carboxylate synthase [Rhodobium orientis]MBK5951065.1 2-succinyl-5-enolpyruvyl-6-hydroxy-3-cyclohexene-1-carboxylic-acid synthase [Rhodobium orientis]RAI26869.1 2-succinyl-5-enolpyruvyl-6-hydroxy-3-cyclohexene-1-carboxylic-acid synthase [Rhodobium orientis]
MSEAADVTFRWAAALIGGLASAGVTRAVISPGSRSTPLTLAALRHPAIACRMVLDERVAAFHALGLAKAEQKPALLIATSGSAIANWLPAVVEADMARVPLILLSADRPPELQDCGANQTMDQIGLFSSHARAFHPLPPAEAETGWLTPFTARVVTESLAPLAGPVHINVPLREPLVPSADIGIPQTATPPQVLAPTQEPSSTALEALASVIAQGRGAIVCGTEDLGAEGRAAVLDLAGRLQVPVFADALSGLRFDPRAGAAVLAHPDQVSRSADAADWILRLGGTPISRALSDWLKKANGRPQIVVGSSPRIADPEGTATHVLTADAATLCRSLGGPPAPAHWLKTFQVADKAAAIAAATASADDTPFEGTVLRRLARALPSDTPLVMANSLPVRALDWLAGRPSSGIRLFGSRGVSGIDGTMSAAFGIASALGPTVAVAGDLAFQHDLGALALGSDLPLVILVLDNGGGAIFDHLPQTVLPEFEEGWLTPSTLDIVAAARSFGIEAETVRSNDAAVSAVLAALQKPAATVIRLPIDRAASIARFRAFFAAR